jgi:hypothetical protein
VARRKALADAIDEIESLRADAHPYSEQQIAHFMELCARAFNLLEPIDGDNLCVNDWKGVLRWRKDFIARRFEHRGFSHPKCETCDQWDKDKLGWCNVMGKCFPETFYCALHSDLTGESEADQ